VIGANGEGEIQTLLEAVEAAEEAALPFAPAAIQDRSATVDRPP